MTRDEARALIAEALHGVNTSVPLNDTDPTYQRHVNAQADAALDALFAGGDEEHRVVNRIGGSYWRHLDAADARETRDTFDRTDPAMAPHRVQSRRTVTLVTEWEDENDG